MNISIQPATKENLNQLHAILVECSQWLKKKKINQWQPVYHKARFTQEVLREHVFSAMLNECEESAPSETQHSQIIGTVTLLPSKPDYYPFGIWTDTQPAWYLCRLAIKPEFTHNNIGRDILQKVEEMARIAGITSLRLDIPATNNFLRQYYLAYGFTEKFQELPYSQLLFFEKNIACHSERNEVEPKNLVLRKEEL